MSAAVQKVGATSRWAQVAEAAAAASDSKYGEKGTIYRKIAKLNGLDQNTVRRAVAARRFLENFAIEQPQLADRLRAAPLAAVEVLARMHRHDRTASVEAGRQLASGRLTVRGIAAQQRETRPTRDLAGRSKERAYRDTFAAELFDFLDRRPVIRPELMPDCPPPLDFVVDAGGHRLGVIIVGPYADPEEYARRLVDWSLKALGLEALGFRIVLIVPTTVLEGMFAGWLTKAPTTRIEVAVWSPGADERAIRELIARIEKASSP